MTDEPVPEGIDAVGVTAWFEAHTPDVAPPLRPLLPSAHDMGREHRIMAALQGSPVPVPPVVGLCTDETVTGAPFYVMRFVDGLILRDQPAAEAVPQPIRTA